ncbi:AI-2E family transporter [Pullulanibacillus sp. KACC 23026]|uniref:AI-2E family transporter n=1 Tax=Pullulanibacillus sp. KACC 23026 TaxID=3028315 RepID=UPI0023AF5648|nr:AI-2E family transporter [Pullulanibacillus sp. KACC 23026]WEG14093.1 AI-2E family transporter [Pullulanibacillus sp. KACC 23026]
MRGTILDWLKRLVLLLLVFINLWFVLKLWPYVMHLLAATLKLMSPFLVAFLIAYILHPMVKHLHRRGMPRALAILIIYLLFFGLSGYGIAKGVPLLLNQLSHLSEQVPALTQFYEEKVDHFYSATAHLPEQVHTHFNRFLLQAEETLNHWIGVIISSIQRLVTSIFTIFLIPFIVFYLLKDIEGLADWLKEHIPDRWQKPAKELLTDIDHSLGSYIRGQLIVCVAVGLAAFIGLWLFKIPYSGVLGFFVGITDIIPFFGAAIGAIPAVIVALTISMNKVFIVIAVITVVQSLEGNLFSPVIVGKSVHLHPILIMVSLVIGGEWGGILGMLVAIPVFVTLREILLFWLRERQKRKQAEWIDPKIDHDRS